jgi:hypothetical protein
VCVRAGADAAENQARAGRFLEKKDALLAAAPNDAILKNALETLRTALHPLPQDRDLASLLDGATFEDGGAVPKSTKDKWKVIAPRRAEALAQGGVDVRAFVAAVRQHAVPGQTPAQNLEGFRNAPKPFPDLDLNYAMIKGKLGAVRKFDEMLTHILNNPCMANIPAANAY